MTEKIIIHSFGFNDRSGKVRWLAEELGLEVEEIEVTEHRAFPYRDLNPYGAIPTVIFRNKTLTESTAICHHLAEHFPEHKMRIPVEHDERFSFLRIVALFSESLEGRTVDYLLGKIGIYAKEFQTLNQRTLDFKYRILLNELPKDGFLVGNRFTLADIIACYNLRNAISAGLIEWDHVKSYILPLAARPAAKRAHFFDAIEDKLLDEAQ